MLLNWDGLKARKNVCLAGWTRIPSIKLASNSSPDWTIRSNKNLDFTCFYVSFYRFAVRLATDNSVPFSHFTSKIPLRTTITMITGYRYQTYFQGPNLRLSVFIIFHCLVNLFNAVPLSGHQTHRIKDCWQSAVVSNDGFFSVIYRKNLKSVLWSSGDDLSITK